MWWETVWEAPRNETKVIRGCGYEQLPLYLIEVVKASNRPAAAVESVRNEMVNGLRGVSRAIESLPARPALPTGDGNGS